MSPTVKAFFDQPTWTLSYVVYDAETRDALVIDPVMNYEPASSKVSTHSLQQLIQFIDQNELQVHLVLETHAHADHMSGAQQLKEKYPSARIGVGKKITEVQKLFKHIFNLDQEFRTDGSQFDLLLDEKKEEQAGSLTVKTLFTPGHTPACATYVIGDAVFTGDALFMPDYGTGRCDFPAGSAEDLYFSLVDKIYTLPDHYRVFVGHDYLPGGRELSYESTIGLQKKNNRMLNQSTSRLSFIQMRSERDQALAPPRLLLPAVQVNINAGHLPEPEENGIAYLKLPIITEKRRFK
ncbi:MAG: MBL fold metallo-hydrolase [Proteobacteria bacterium]|jgi:glyoxylase-like metal-dependent hydrolase (beta-lactamase superfamily II)|nr:MBL fold metallo-hydrolase [Pseudomonadota bacterium]